MPSYLRPNVTGACIFFTVNLARRRSTLLLDEVDRLRTAVRETKRDHPFRIEAWVVLPDHMHCVWRLPVGDGDFSMRWRLIKSRFSRGLPMGPRRASHELRRERGVWQRRFWEHHIRDQADYWTHVRYCWLNPVKHGYVKRPEDWPYSSVQWDSRFKAGIDDVL